MAPGRGCNDPFVSDSARCGTGVEQVSAAEEVGVSHVETGCRKAGGIDPRPFAEDHAVGVNEEHLAVGVESTHDI